MQPVRARTYRHARPVAVVVVAAVGTANNTPSMRGGGGAPKVTAGKRGRILLPAVGVVDIIGFGVRGGGEAANCPASPSRRGGDDVASAFVHDDDVMSFMTPARAPCALMIDVSTLTECVLVLTYEMIKLYKTPTPTPQHYDQTDQQHRSDGRGRDAIRSLLSKGTLIKTSGVKTKQGMSYSALSLELPISVLC